MHSGQGQKVNGRGQPVVFWRSRRSRTQTDGEWLLATLPALQYLWVTSLLLTSHHPVTGSYVHSHSSDPTLIAELSDSSEQSTWGRKLVADTHSGDLRIWRGCTESKTAICSAQARALSQISTIDGTAMKFRSVITAGLHYYSRLTLQ